MRRFFNAENSSIRAQFWPCGNGGSGAGAGSRAANNAGTNNNACTDDSGATGGAATGADAARSESELAIPARPRLAAAGGRSEGRDQGAVYLPSKVYPGTQHTYWVYVPAQYDPAVPAALMVYQDGQAFKDENGDMRAQNVMDNLIYRREIPVMIGVFINPGRTPEQPEPTPQRLGRRQHQPRHGIQHARRQVRAGDYRRTDARAGQGVQHLERPGNARYRRVEFGRDRRVHGGVGASQRVPQGVEQRGQFREPAGRRRLPGARSGKREEADPRLFVRRAQRQPGTGAQRRLTTRSATGSTRTCA